MSESPSFFLHNLVYFGRLLRAMGLDIQPDGISNLVKATQWIAIEKQQDFYNAARSLLVRREQDLTLFDEAFDQFWRRTAGGKLAVSSSSEQVTEIALDLILSDTHETDSMAVMSMLRYSPLEVLREKDFADLDADELEAAKLLLTELVWKLGSRYSRRWRQGTGNYIDARHMLRQSLRHGGELFHIPRRTHRRKPRRLVVLADISGSMERYSSLLLHFVFGLTESLDQWVEAFVFGTRLTRITRQLRGHNVERSLREIERHVPDWSGGTRIGESIKAFNFYWARRVLARGAVVLLLSDGWDRGDTDLLSREMARLQRSSYRLIWLNPLLGSLDYEPLTRGMQASLPFIDDFLPVHNLSSVEELASSLEALEERRPVRKQQPRQVLFAQSSSASVSNPNQVI